MLRALRGLPMEDILAGNVEGPSDPARITKFVKTTSDLDVEELMEHHPRLHDLGYGDNGDGKPWSTAQLTSTEGLAMINHLRRMLPVCFRPLRKITPNSPGSYSTKGILERIVGHYFTNGHLVAAVLLEPIIPVQIAEPNIVIGIDRRDYDKVRAISLEAS